MSVVRTPAADTCASTLHRNKGMPLHMEWFKREISRLHNADEKNNQEPTAAFAPNFKLGIAKELHPATPQYLPKRHSQPHLNRGSEW